MIVTVNRHNYVNVTGHNGLILKVYDLVKIHKINHSPRAVVSAVGSAVYPISSFWSVWVA